jgi:hypothetical protein
MGIGKRNNLRAREKTAANLGYEAELWRMADALRGSVGAAEYKHAVLGLIFLKYISDAFEEHRRRRTSGGSAAGRRCATPSPRQERLSTGRAEKGPAGPPGEVL